MSRNDGLAGGYSSLADDSAKTKASREAGMLVAAAEGHLNVDEDFTEAMKSAGDAYKLFSDAGDGKGEADAMRIMIQAYRVKAQFLRYDTNPDASKQAYEEGEAKAKEMIETFKSKANKRGEASMLLSLAEIYFDKKSSKRKETSVQTAQEALDIFKELGDESMEASATCSLAATYFKMDKNTEAVSLFTEALATYQRLGDKRGQARALHSLAGVISQGPVQAAKYLQGVQYVKEALSLFRELGSKKMIAQELLFLAKWYLTTDKPRDALKASREAMALLKEINYGKGWQAESRGTVMQALTALEETREALRLGEESVAYFKKQEDKRSQAIALDYLITAHLESEHRGGNMAEALEYSQQGVHICKQLGDEKWQATMLHDCAQASLRMRQLDKAKEYAEDSCLIFIAANELDQQAIVMHTLLEIYSEMGEGDKAIEVAEEIQSIAKTTGTKMEEARTTLLVAQVQLSAGMFDEALAAAMEAQASYQEDGDKSGEGNAWAIISDIRRLKGEEDEAIRAKRTTSNLYLQAGDKKAQAYALKDNVQLLIKKDKPDDAVRMANEALTIARASGDTRTEVEMLIVAAEAHLTAITKQVEAVGFDAGVQILMRGEDRALRPAREAVALGRKIDKQLTAVALHYVAMLHVMSGRSAAGLKATQDAVELFKASNDEVGLAYSLLLGAEASFMKGDKATADADAAAALAKFRDCKDDEGTASAMVVIDRFEREAPGVKVPTVAAVADDLSSAGGGEASGGGAIVKAALKREDAEAMARECAIQSVGDEAGIDMDSAIMDLGLDSLASIAFREQLITTSGLKLPTSLVFDYPSLSAIAEFMVEASRE